MGRQTRQARRAQERRAHARDHQAAQGPDRKWLLAGLAVVVAAIALIAYFYATNSSSNSAAGTPTVVPATAINGVGCNPGGEVVTYHEHAHVALINKGKQVAIPALIGFDVNHDCLFWVHTHGPASDGIIHEEAPHKVVPQLNTFFKIWGQPLTASKIATIKVGAGEQVRTYINGKPYAGALGAIKLPPHQDVVIEVGPPFVPPPKFNFASHNV